MKMEFFQLKCKSTGFHSGSRRAVCYEIIMFCMNWIKSRRAYSKAENSRRRHLNPVNFRRKQKMAYQYPSYRDWYWERFAFSFPVFPRSPVLHGAGNFG